MLREWADEERGAEIDEALTDPGGGGFGGQFSDDEAWASFSEALS